MNSQEFNDGMRRLGSQFKGAYSEERVAVIFEEVKDLPGHWWTRTVSKFLGECRQPPLMPEIRTEAGVEREKVHAIQRRRFEADSRVPQPGDGIVVQRVWCVQCSDTGSIVATRIADGSIWAFKCNCAAGKRDRRNFPVWSEAAQSEFKVSA